MKKAFEVFDPIKDFYAMRSRKKAEVSFYVVFPILIALVFLIFDSAISTCRDFSLDGFTQDFLNQIITMLVLFISFSMAYLSIIITSSSENVNNLKTTYSKEHFLLKKNCTLYQVLVNEITYELIFEIIFLILVFFEKFLIYLLNDTLIKYIIALNISLFIHVLLIMMLAVKDIYYSFWKSK